MGQALFSLEVVFAYWETFYKFYRTVSNNNLNKNAKSSCINTSRPSNIDQIWELKKVRLQNLNNVIIGNININSISGKFD